MDSSSACDQSNETAPLYSYPFATYHPRQLRVPGSCGQGKKLESSSPLRPSHDACTRCARACWVTLDGRYPTRARRSSCAARRDWTASTHNSRRPAPARMLGRPAPERGPLGMLLMRAEMQPSCLSACSIGWRAVRERSVQACPWQVAARMYCGS